MQGRVARLRKPRQKTRFVPWTREICVAKYSEGFFKPSELARLARVPVATMREWIGNTRRYR